MCMTLVAAYGDVGIIATDTRHNHYHADGVVRRVDSGGKLTQCAWGWITGTGEAEILDAALAAAVLAAFDGVADAVAHAARRRMPAILARLTPGVSEARGNEFVRQVTEAQLLALHVAHDNIGAFAVGADGERFQGGVNRFFIGFPPDVTHDDRARHLKRFASAAGSARSLTDLVQSTARLFAGVATQSQTMSAEIDLVYSAKRPAGDIISCRVGGIAAAVAARLLRPRGA